DREPRVALLESDLLAPRSRRQARPAFGAHDEARATTGAADEPSRSGVDARCGRVAAGATAADAAFEIEAPADRTHDAQTRGGDARGRPAPRGLGGVGIECVEKRGRLTPPLRLRRVRGARAADPPQHAAG